MLKPTTANDEESSGRRRVIHSFNDELLQNLGDAGPSSLSAAEHLRRHSAPVQDDENEQDLVFSDDMTVRDRQAAINQSHPFGIRLWKPALYKKMRTIQQVSYRAVHEQPPYNAHFITTGNVLWLVCFGWWLCLVYFALSIFLLALSGFTHSGRRYAALCFMMSGYLLWPFGRFVERVWQFNGWENEPLLSSTNNSDRVPNTQPAPIFTLTQVDGMTTSDSTGERTATSIDASDDTAATHPRQRLLSMTTLSSIWAWIRSMGYSDWVFWMAFSCVIFPLHLLVASICWLLVLPIPMANLLWQLTTHIRTIPKQLRFSPLLGGSSALPSGEILLCTYQSIGLQYYKYTYDGINIMFINLLSVVIFALVDGFWLAPALNYTGIGSPSVVFALCVLSVIPLAYFIGMAVASISSQSSFGLGAVINATFGSIVEIILYWMAIREGKGLLVEGAIVGSFLGTLLLLPGVSMIAGGVGKWKEQRFNVKSASVSTVLLIMALIGAFTPTLFYSVYGSYELKCKTCDSGLAQSNLSPASLMMGCTGCSYTLPHNPSQDSVYVNQVRPLMYLCAAFLPTAYIVGLWFTLRTHVKQIYHSDTKKHDSVHLGTSSARSSQHMESSSPDSKDEHEGGGHDAPEWSKMKSAAILLVSTVLFALLAEKLVNTVDEVISHSGIPEKFLGLTLFALIPSFTEFLNAVAFAMYGNISLSLEIGGAYVVQIALIQIPILVGLSGLWKLPETIEKSFTLIFPTWDCYAVFFSVFLLSYTYIEGKSNYFKGSVLTLSYLVLIVSFWFSSQL